jgi:glycosyltransferase involved in cell wall biosynthesis
MRILLLSDFYPPVVGGVEQHVRSLGRELAERGHEVTVATIDTIGTRPPVEDDRGAMVYRLGTTLGRARSLYAEAGRPFAPPAPDPELTLNLARLIRRVRPDVVHAHGWIVHSYLPIHVLGALPLVVTLHEYGLVCAKKNLLYKGATCSGPALGKCLACAGRHYGPVRAVPITLAGFISGPLERRLATTFIAVSEAVAEASVITGLDHEVIPNFLPRPAAADPGVVRPWVDLLPDEPFLLFVGALGTHKGFRVLLEAYRQLEVAPPLVCIGHRWVDTPAEIPAGVSVFEDWPHDAVRAAWSRALLGLVPSLWAEPFGIVAIEAMQAGIPVIASDTGGLSGVVDDGVTGTLVTPGDPAALASAIETLVRDEAGRTAMGVNARAAAARYDADVVVPKIEAVYARVVGEARSRGGRPTHGSSATIDAHRGGRAE